jgi:hypothetical protein
LPAISSLGTFWEFTLCVPVHGLSVTFGVKLRNIMNKGINIGRCRGVNIVDYTQAFNIGFFLNYIEEGLSASPEEHLQSVANINIYDECPSYAPAIAMGGYYPSQGIKGAALDIYLDQNLGHLLSDSPRGKLTRFFDGIFIRMFGKYFIIHMILHELGHHVFEITATVGTKDDNEASEKYAGEYANEIYNKKYPLQHKYYGFISSLYHLLYWRRILRNDEIRGHPGANVRR